MDNKETLENKLICEHFRAESYKNQMVELCIREKLLEADNSKMIRGLRGCSVKIGKLEAENSGLKDEADELRKTCIIFDKENVEFKKKLERMINEAFCTNSKILELKSDLKEVAGERDYFSKRLGLEFQKWDKLKESIAILKAHSVNKTITVDFLEHRIKELESGAVAHASKNRNVK